MTLIHHEKVYQYFQLSNCVDSKVKFLFSSRWPFNRILSFFPASNWRIQGQQSVACEQRVHSSHGLPFISFFSLMFPKTTSNQQTRPLALQAPNNSTSNVLSMLLISETFISSRLKVIILVTLLTMRAGSTALISGQLEIHFFMDFMGMPQTSSQKSTLQSEKYSSWMAAHLKESVLGKMGPPFFRKRSLAKITSSNKPSKCRQQPIGQAIMASTLALKSFQSKTSIVSCSLFSLMISFIICTDCFSRSPLSSMTQQTLLAPALAAKMEYRQLIPSVIWRTVLPAKWSWFSMMTWQYTWWVSASSMFPYRLLMERQFVWLRWAGYYRFSMAFLTDTQFQLSESFFWCFLPFFLVRDGWWWLDIGDNSRSNYIMMSIISNPAFHSIMKQNTFPSLMQVIRV